MYLFDLIRAVRLPELEEDPTEVRQRLDRQEKDARIWRDACLLYFQQFSRRPLPAAVEPAPYPLDHCKAINLRLAPGHPGDK
jgi:alpha-glucuronidase